MSLNKNIVILAGRLAADPELRMTNSGKNVSQFTIAVSKEYDNKQADFIKCVAWEKTADFICKYWKKGMPIFVQGSIQVRKVETDGKTTFYTEVLVNKVDFVESKKETTTTETYAPVSDDALPF